MKAEDLVEVDDEAEGGKELVGSKSGQGTNGTNKKNEKNLGQGGSKSKPDEAHLLLAEESSDRKQRKDATNGEGKESNDHQTEDDLNFNPSEEDEGSEEESVDEGEDGEEQGSEPSSPRGGLARLKGPIDLGGTFTVNHRRIVHSPLSSPSSPSNMIKAGPSSKLATDVGVNLSPPSLAAPQRGVVSARDSARAAERVAKRQLQPVVVRNARAFAIDAHDFER